MTRRHGALADEVGAGSGRSTRSTWASAGEAWTSPMIYREPAASPSASAAERATTASAPLALAAAASAWQAG